MSAAPLLYANGLSRNGLDALVVVAEACMEETRQGRVPLSRVVAVLNVSDRTASRAMRELTDRCLVVKLQRGHRFRRDDGEHGVATLYLLPPLVQSPAIQVAGGRNESPATQVAGGDVAPPQSPAIQSESPAIRSESPATLDGGNSVDPSGGVLRGNARASSSPRPDPLEHACRRCARPRRRACVGPDGRSIATWFHDERQHDAEEAARVHT